MWEVSSPRLMSLNEPAVAITAAANRLATMTVRGLNSSGEAAVLDNSLITTAFELTDSILIQIGVGNHEGSIIATPQVILQRYFACRVS